MTFVHIGEALQARLRSILEENLDLASQGRLVGLDGQKIIGSRLRDRLGDGWIAGDRVDADDRPFQSAAGRQPFQKHRNGAQFIGFVADRFLTKHQSAGGGERRNQMERRPIDAAIMAAPRGFPIDGHQFGMVRPASANPVGKTCRKQRRTDPVHHDRQPPPRRDAVMKRQKPPQEVQMGRSPAGDVLVVVTIGDRPAYSQKQKLRQRISHPMGLAIILNDGKMIQQHPKARAFSKITRRKVPGGSPNQPAL